MENWHILWQQNLFLKTFLKFLFIITSKQYNTLEKVKKNSYSYCNQVMARTKLGSRKVPRAKKDHRLKSTAKLFSTEESETKCLNSKTFYHISRRWKKIKQGERVVRIMNNRCQYLFIFILRHVNSVWLILKYII